MVALTVTDVDAAGRPSNLPSRRTAHAASRCRADTTVGRAAVVAFLLALLEVVHTRAAVGGLIVCAEIVFEAGETIECAPAITATVIWTCGICDYTHEDEKDNESTFV